MRLTTPFRSVSLLILIVASNLAIAVADSPNFIATDKTIVEVAEQARRESAIFWTGQALPGDWYQPCPITVSLATHAGGGVTQFRFVNGEVGNWSMRVAGTRTAILTDVIPHEVDHMVRASLVRKPIARWLDEGCASLMEGEATHAQLRQRARQLSAELITSEFLDGQDYPSGAHQLDHLYAVGFTLVEVLLEQAGPDKLLQLQHHEPSIVAGLQQLYGLDVYELRALWRKSLQSRTGLQIGCEHGCLRHHSDKAQTATCRCLHPPDNLLVIWGADWCGPCRRFWHDYQHDTGFRKAINSRFHVHCHDFDQQRPVALQQGIRAVPTFVWQGQRVTGYTSPHALLRQLGINPPTPKSQPVVKPQSAPTVPSITEQEISAPNSPQQSDLPPNASQSKPPDIGVEAADQPEIPVPQVIPSFWNDVRTVMIHFLPLGFTALQWAGLLGGSFASGGVGALVLAMLYRHWSRPRTESPAVERRDVPTPAPFPRQLDEARQLLELRQSEGRVGLLDALRGMFLDDELDKLAHAQTPQVADSLHQLRANIDARVDEVAPLSTKIQ